MRDREKQKANRKRKLVQDSTYEDKWNQPSVKKSTYSNGIQSSSSIQNEDSFYTIEWNKLTEDASIWPFLTIRGPNHHIFSYLGNDVMKNKPMCHLLRQTAWKIYTKMMEFRNEDVPMIIKNINHFNMENTINIVEEMCQKILRFEITGEIKVDFYEEGMVKRLRNLFAKKTLKIEFGEFRGTFKRLNHLSHLRQFWATSEQLGQARNAIVRYIFDLSLDLIVWITKRNARRDPNRILIERAIESPFICKTKESNTGFKWLKMSARLEEVSTSLMERNDHKSSLWVSIHHEEKRHFLEFVLGYNLVKVLTKKAEEFFINWFRSIKSRMIRMLSDDVLRQSSKKVMSESLNGPRTLGGARIRNFLVEIAPKVLNLKEFEIFNEGWQNYTLDLIGKMRGEAFQRDLDCERLVKHIRRITSPSVLTTIASFYPSSHILINLLRFVLCFLLNTIRHVFHFNPNTFEVYYDGKFEGDGKENAGIHQEYEEESHNGHFDGDEHYSVSDSGNHRNAQKNVNKRRRCDSEEQFEEPERIQQKTEVRSTKQPKTESQTLKKRKRFDSDEQFKEHESIQQNVRASMIPVTTHEWDHTEPPEDPIQVRHQSAGPSSNVFSNPCSSTQQVPVVQEKDSIDIDEDVPLKWQKAYKLLVEWNQELETEFRRIQETLSQFK